MNARDKMPFEVTPVFFRLIRYTPPVAAAPTPAAGSADTAASGGRYAAERGSGPGVGNSAEPPVNPW